MYFPFFFFVIKYRYANDVRLWNVDIGIYGDYGENQVSDIPYPGPHGETSMCPTLPPLDFLPLPSSPIPLIFANILY